MPELDSPESQPARRVRIIPLMEDESVLAFDFGARRIGVAIGNSVTRQARPLAVLTDRSDALWRRLAELVAAWQPAQLVVGVARHPDGAGHAMTERCERFARQLAGRYRLPVARVDERYSSAVVKDGRDDEAAAVILQQWFDETDAVRDQPIAATATARVAEGRFEPRRRREKS
jgi:putative Holliday junction resolvase